MMNVLEINKHKAIIKYDPEIGMFRGEFTGLNGGADFYAKDIDGLKKEGELSLNLFLEACERRGIEAHKKYSGRFNVRVPGDLHKEIAGNAAAKGKSLNQWVVDAIRHEMRT